MDKAQVQKSPSAATGKQNTQGTKTRAQKNNSLLHQIPNSIPFQIHNAFNNLTPDHLIHLQRTLGNQAVGRIIQAKLTISEPDDPYEREADQVADKVMRMPDPVTSGEEETKVQTKPLSNQITPLVHRMSPINAGSVNRVIQRLCSGCAEEGKPEMAQRKQARYQLHDDRDEEEQRAQPKGVRTPTPHVTPSIAANIHAMNHGGSPLPKATRSFFEPRFGVDFSGVRVHTGSHATATAKSINARAFTVGRNIAFGAGEYSPDTTVGRKLLAHELTHVVQRSSLDGIRDAQIKSNHFLFRNLEGSETALARQMNEEGELDAGVASPGIDAGAGSLRDDQEACVRRLGGCPETRSGGIPRSEDISSYNDQCRNETQYTGEDVQPSCHIVAPVEEPPCRTVMGGRKIDHWTGYILGQEHTYVNFEDNTGRWLIEGGPDPASPNVTGSWVKPGSWESRGNRISTVYSMDRCLPLKQDLFNTTAQYHSLRLPYDPTRGPNSNSFAEQLTFKTGVPASFNPFWDHQCYYWRSRPRPF